MTRPVLDDEDVERELAARGSREWQLLGGKLVRTVDLQTFAGALRFVNDVGMLAEAADHHPDIDIRYKRVTLALVTHDSGGITMADLDLAAAVDRLETGGPGQS